MVCERWKLQSFHTFPSNVQVNDCNFWRQRENTAKCASSEMSIQLLENPFFSSHLSDLLVFKFIDTQKYLKQSYSSCTSCV